MTENSQNYLDLLNKEQRNAVQQTDGSLLVLAVLEVEKLGY